jgi:hypothetical protein
MRKSALLFVLLFTLVITACQEKEKNLVTPTISDENMDSPASSDLVEPATCTAISIQSDVSYLQEGDWFYGAETPSVTLIEYGDYQ